jgi:hypothetical protein
MSATISRQELHEMIDNLPDQFIQTMTPFIACIMESYWKPVIEPANDEETALIDEAVKEYDRDPESFRLWEEIRK